MTYEFSASNGESEFRNEMTAQSNEPGEDSHLEADYEDRVSGFGFEQEPDNGWDREDDLVDMNDNEQNDYLDE